MISGVNRRVENIFGSHKKQDYDEYEECRVIDVEFEEIQTPKEYTAVTVTQTRLEEKTPYAYDRNGKLVFASIESKLLKEA